MFKIEIQIYNTEKSFSFGFLVIFVYTINSNQLVFFTFGAEEH